MVDGQGIAHPRYLGIASHLGLWLDLPTIGCAKSILRGHYNEKALSEEAGAWVPLVFKGETVGAAVRTRSHVKPMFISYAVFCMKNKIRPVKMGERIGAMWEVTDGLKPG